jgi:hypothetical protein
MAVAMEATEDFMMKLVSEGSWPFQNPLSLALFSLFFDLTFVSQSVIHSLCDGRGHGGDGGLHDEIGKRANKNLV